jgi:hypothetical protein
MREFDPVMYLKSRSNLQLAINADHGSVLTIGYLCSEDQIFKRLATRLHLLLGGRVSINQLRSVGDFRIMYGLELPLIIFIDAQVDKLEHTIRSIKRFAELGFVGCFVAIVDGPTRAQRLHLYHNGIMDVIDKDDANGVRFSEVILHALAVRDQQAQQLCPST